MKVAITTWWHHHNYGTSLQVAALHYTLSRSGYDTDVIDYTPNGRIFPTTANADYEYATTHGKYIRVVDDERNLKYGEFLQKHLSFTMKVEDDDDFAELSDEYDAFIAGSDQIWAPSVFDGRYFLDYVCDDRKKISYAPSIGLPSIKNEYVKEKTSDLIAKFAHLSIREQQGADTIRDELGVNNVEVMPDPTLLLDYNEWRSLIPKDQKVTKQKYILCYFLGHNENAWKHVKKISNQFNMPVKIVPIFQKDNSRGEFLSGVGPNEFFNYIDEAEMVLTDSFHGLIFSIITKTPFYIFERFRGDSDVSQNSRIYNLLEVLKLKHRLIRYDEGTREVYDFNIKFQAAQKAIDIQKKRAIEFLNKSLTAVKSTISEQASDGEMVDITREFSVRSGILSVVDPNITTRLDRFGQFAYFVKKEYKPSQELQKKLDYVDSMYNLSETEDSISSELFKSSISTHPIIGSYTGLYIGHVKSNKERSNSTSGGVATYVLAQLLKRKMIDYVICPMQVNDSDGILYKYQVCKSSEDIKKSAKTKYYPLNLSEVLRYVKKHDGKYAIVGITGYIYELRLLQKVDSLFKDRIKYTIGLITCHQKTTKYTEQIAWQHGIDPKTIRNFEYRVKNSVLRPDVYLTEFTGERRGKMVTLQTATTDNYATDWAHGFFKTSYSDYTDDVFNKTADITLGDAWSEYWVGDKGGNNVVVCRNGDIEHIIDDGISKGELELIEVSGAEVLETQKGNIHHMVDDLPFRIQQYRPKGLRISTDIRYMDRQIPIERQLIQRIRHHISVESHKEYLNALKNNNYGLFVEKTKCYIEQYRLLYSLLPKIELLESNNRELEQKKLYLTDKVNSFLSTRRSARLLAGNIKRRYSRCAIGKLKRALRIRTRARALLQKNRLYLNNFVWFLRNIVIDYRVNKIAKQQLDKGNRIPRIIHYIWVGGAKKPESVEKYIKTWRKYCPDYKIIEWNEKNYDIMSNRYAREAYKAKKWAFVTDYIRLDVLDRFGGIYMDSDVEVLKSLDEFLREPAFSSFEAGDPTQIFLPTGMMASERKGSWVRYLKSYYSPERSFFQKGGQVDNTTNTSVITRMTVDKYGIKLNNKLQKFDDFTMYPSEYFCPKSWSTRKINLTANTHTIHHFAASWLPEDVRELQHKGEE